jgi:hypothetical protein
MDSHRPPYRMSRGFKVFLWLLAMVIVSPVLLWAALFVVIIGGSAVNEFVHSGSAKGDEALDRAGNVLNDLDGGRWRVVATDAGAVWSAPDMGGDRIENYAFTLPPAEVPRFRAALDAQWTERPIDGRKPGDSTVNYVYEGASLILDPDTGRVEINWGNFYSLTPTTKPLGYDAPSTRPRS